MQEASVSIDALRPWLSRVAADEAVRVLVGCELDDGKSEELAPVHGVDVPAQVLIVDSGRRVSLKTLGGGMIVDRRPGHPLLLAISGAKTPAERREAEIDAELRRRRVDPGSLRSAADREQVLKFLLLVETGERPSEPALHAFYEAMKPAASASKHRRAAEALQALMATCVRHRVMPPSLPWRLVWFLNRSGQFEEAVAATETPQALAVQGMHRAYLATIRASALIALAEVRHDTGLLDKAEAALKIAYAIEGRASEEVQAVYRALDRARSRDESSPPRARRR